LARESANETGKTIRLDSAFFTEHIANPLHALLDGTLNGTNQQIQPKMRERTHHGPDSHNLRRHCHYDINAGKSPQLFCYKIYAKFAQRSDQPICHIPKRARQSDFLAD
jgi:hypothetical protein